MLRTPLGVRLAFPRGVFYEILVTKRGRELSRDLPPCSLLGDSSISFPTAAWLFTETQPLKLPLPTPSIMSHVPSVPNDAFFEILY